MSKRLIQLLTVSAALAVVGVAGATTRTNDVPSIVVRYGALALNTKAGVVSLHSRIRAAAETVCSPLNSRVLGLREQYDVCVIDATSQAVAEVGNANLSNYHRFGAKASLVASN